MHYKISEVFDSVSWLTKESEKIKTKTELGKKNKRRALFTKIMGKHTYEWPKADENRAESYLK